MRVADINGDGLPDIIYGDAFVFPNVIHILLAQPGGGYTAAPPFTLPSQTVAVCQPIDANGDRKLDLVCSYYPPTGPYGEYLETFFGNGDGTFQPPIVSTVSTIFNVYDSVFIYPRRTSTPMVTLTSSLALRVVPQSCSGTAQDTLRSPVMALVATVR